MEKQLPQALLTTMINGNKELKQILENIPKGGPLREKIQEWATDIDTEKNLNQAFQGHRKSVTITSMNLDDNVLKGYNNEIQKAIQNEIQDNENDKAKRHKTTYEELLSEHLYVKATQLYLEQIINANENASIESLEKIKKSQDLMELATASAKTAKTDAPFMEKIFSPKNTKEYKDDFTEVLQNITTALDKAYEEELNKHKKEVEKTRNNQEEENRKK